MKKPLRNIGLWLVFFVLPTLIVLRMNPPLGIATILQKSSSLGLWPIIRLQLFLGVSPEGPDMPPLIHAIKGNHPKAAAVLIAGGANIERTFWSGEPNGPPLMWAILWKRREIAKMLIDAGARIDGYETSSGGETIMIDAIRRGDPTMVDLLLQHGSKEVNVGDNARQTPLHYAAMYGNLSIADILVRSGARINARTIDGKTPLSVAIEGDKSEMVEFLMKHGGRK